MKTINGISVGNYTFNTIQNALDINKRVFVSVPSLEGGILGDCPNCGGGGVIVVTITPRFPLSSPVGTVMSSSDGWLKAETTSDPCPICKGTPNMEELMEDSGLSYTESGWTLDYIDGMAGKENAARVARSVLAMSPKPTGLYVFFGDYGVGKSGIIKSMTSALVKSYVKCKYVRASDYLSEVRSTYGDNSEESEVQLLDMYLKYQFLAIDEVDRISDTDWARATMFALLDKRYENRSKIATVMVTNQFPDRMGKQWAYLMSRLLDGVRVPVGGRSLRGVQ